MRQFNRVFLGDDVGVVPMYQRASHTYVVGQSGTGKSRAIESWVMQDVAAGRGIGVIDPHGDLFRNLLLRLAARPEVWKRVVILDPLNSKWTVGFNPLQAIGSLSQERLALYLTDVGIKIWQLSPSNAPRMVWLLTNTFLALAGLGLTLLDLPRFLMDRDFRERLLIRLPIEAARSFFQYEFPKSEGAIHQWVTPVLNKIGGLIFDPDIRLMFMGGSTIDFRQLLDRRLILLVNLSKGMLGEAPSALLAAFIVAHLQKAALSRADTQRRVPFYLYLDEFQNYTTDNIKDILSESRKYALSLILAHQYLDQLSADLRSAVLNTAGTLTSFRVSYNDAYHLAKEIFPSPDFLSTRETNVRFNRSGLLPFPRIWSRQDKPGWDGLALLLSKLRPREFWVRRRGPYLPIKQRTFEMPDPVLDIELESRMQALLDLSGKRFGRLKSEVEPEFKHRYAHFQNGKTRERQDDFWISPWTL